MMKLLRNPEVAKTLLVYCILSSTATLLAFYQDRRLGWPCFALCAMFISIYILSTFIRYRRIYSMSADINQILHGDSHISLDKYAEGELGILQSEVHKMTVRLREQQQRLLDDKIYLADSIADISHQIRTPLTSANLLISFLSEPGLSNERRQSLSHELYDLLAQIEWLITALLKISKLDARTVQFKLESIPLQDLIRKAVTPLLIPIELRAQELTIAAEGMFEGDISWTCEALANILKNCMEHTPQQGKITVHAQENPLYSEIIITDNGNGIAKEDLPHIFERFYKGKHSDDKSFGIGLALSRMIITAQNGTIKAENASPAGAKFTIRFYKGTV